MRFAKSISLVVSLSISIGSATAQKLIAVETAATAARQMNGVAAARDGRLFVSMPRWGQADSYSVGVIQNGKLQPYPGGGWNTWKAGLAPAAHFISVNSVRIEADDPATLWAVDSAPGVKGGPKLVRIDLTTNQVQRVYSFPADIAGERSYLNDVRVFGGRAFMTESGIGSLIIVDLTTGAARRLLAGSSKTKATPGRTPLIDGKK